MDNDLFNLLDTYFPPFNESICEGIAIEHMAKVESYINNVIKCAEPGFPEGLRYEYPQRCTPKEAYAFATRNGSKNNSNKRSFELAESNIYLMKYYFSFNGEMLPPKYLYLPYVTDGGMISIRGARFCISPVLTDKAISVGPDSLFIPLTRAKLTFNRILHHFIINGMTTSAYIVYSTVYNRSQKNIRLNGKPTVQANHTLMHYLFCKYGVIKTFKYFAGADVVIGKPDDITVAKYPRDQWVICQSTGLKPHGLKDRYYVSTQLRLALPAEQYNQVVASMIGGFFYVVDHFPQRIEPQYLDGDGELHLWRVLLGHVIWGSNVSEGKLAEDANAHMESLDEYVDEMAREILREENIHAADLYQLFMYIIENMSELILTGSTDVGSMYNKRLTVLRYVLSNLIGAIFQFMFKLRSNTKKQLTKEDIITAMNRINSDTIVQINKNHGEVTTVSSPGDNKFFKITSKIVLQANSAGKSASKGSLNDQSMLLHSSILEIGSFGNLPKSDPTGRSVANGHLICDEAGNIHRNPDLKDVIDNVQRLINR